MIETVELQLDAKTLKCAQQLAASRHCTLNELIMEIIEQLDSKKAATNPFLGMFADEPELIDEALESAMKAREEHPLRQTNG